VKTITREELQALLVTGDLALIEALPQAHYDREHLPGALNVPGALDADLAAALVPDPGTTVVTYCSGPACGRSKATAAAFTRLGYTDVRVYPGGKSDWLQAGLAFESAHALTR